MLVLPTKTIPQNLLPFVEQNSVPSRKMLNGYRNRLTKSLKLVLSNDINYCGQAYSYILKQDKQLIEKIKTYENEEQILQSVQNNFVLIAKKQTVMFDWNKQKITVQQIGNILTNLADEKQSENVGKNLLLNIFDSYEQLQMSGLLPILMTKQPQTNPIITQQQNNSYFGENILNVPQVNTKSGTWSTQKNIKLTIHNKNQKKQEKIQVK